MNKRLRDEIERDIREHIEMETRDNIERGMPPAEARAAALRKFGNPLLAAENTRAVWQWLWAERLLQDFRYALRGLRRNPLFAAVAILTLALGIGMNTAVFSVANAVLLRPLPYPHAERLLWLANYNPAFKAEVVTDSEYLAWREQSLSYDRIACYGYGNQNLAYGNNIGQAIVAEVAADFWPMAGARAAAGRLPGEQDRDTIVLSHHLWTQRFGGDPAIIGKTVTLDGDAATVVGILPADFLFLFPIPPRPDIQPTRIDAYVPIQISPEPQQRGRALVSVVARLKPGASLEQARAELETIEPRIRLGLGFGNPMSVRVVPVRERLVGGARPALLILLGAVALVLLIACANIAGLLLARSAARRREIAIRAAVGAGKSRMIGQFLAEGLALALAGGVAGCVVARAALVLLTRMGPRTVPRLESASIDGRALLFTLLLSIGCGLLFSAGPAAAISRLNLVGHLKEGGPILSPGLRLRAWLVAGEIAMAVLLLIGAGLMLKSLWRMNARPPGFQPEQILVMKASLSGPAYSGRPQQIAYFEDALGRLKQIPGVAAAGSIFSPVRGVVEMEDAPRRPADRMPRAVFYSTSSGYFRAMGIRLIAGRWMTDRETSQVVLVNESFVRSDLGGGPALGRRVHVPRNDPPPSSEIVGVVSDVKYSRLDAEPSPEVYFPYLQSPFNRAADLVVRVSGHPAALLPAVRESLSGIDRSQPITELQTLEQALAESIAPRRFNLYLLAAFASTALLLALIGVYGVMSYSVTQRAQEIGIRMALGARRPAIVHMVVRQGMIVALAGIVVGIAAALALTRLMATLLFEVTPDDPATFAAVSIALAAAALAASWLPALRASRLDPLKALRYE